MGNVPKKIYFNSIIPEKWRKENSIWFSAYTIANLEQSDLPQVLSLDIMGIKVIAFWGKLQYYSSDEVKMLSQNQGILNIELKTPKLKTSKFGSWLLFLTPYSEEKQMQEFLIKRKIKTARGLICSVLGKNAAEHHFFDNIFHLKTNQMTVFGPIFRNPFTDPKPIFSRDLLSTMQIMCQEIEKIPIEETRNRYYLSLQWFSDSLDDDGVDAFLKVWIAIEVLLMQNSENVKPLKKILVKGYDISPEDTTEEFLIGYLCRLRGAIVHNGSVTSLHYGVITYLEELYKDFLYLSLEFSCPNYARKYLKKCKFDLKKIVKSYL